MMFEISWKGSNNSVITDNYIVKTTGNNGRNHATIQVGYHPEGKSRKKWFTLIDCPEHKDGAIIIREAETGRRIETYSFE